MSSASKKIGKARVFPALCELVGAFFLCLVPLGVNIGILVRTSLDPFVATLSAIVLFGLTLATLVYTLGPRSGGHLNPAVTISLASIGKFPLGSAILYIVAQFTGALLACWLLLGLFGEEARGKAALGAPSLTEGTTLLTGFGVEALISALLVGAVLLMTVSEDSESAGSAIAIGNTLILGISFGYFFTGGGVNPARSLAPLLFNGITLTDVVVYGIAPVAGGLLVAMTYELALKKATDPSSE